MKNSSTKYDHLINPEVYKHITSESYVLDVGCWKGELGHVLISKKNCSVDGVEINKKAIVDAKKNGIKHIYKVDLNFESIKLSSIKGKYDYIILADVIEHLLHPEEVLAILQKKLKKNGKLIISTPNIAFILFRFKLLFGKFDYVNGPGVMDITHTRFFTIDSLKKTLKTIGYEVETCYGYSIVKNHFFFLRYLSQIFPKLFGIQILLVATRNG